jgi:hypothetical protein
LFLQVLLVVLKLPRLNGLHTIDAEIYHLAQTADLTWQIHDVKSTTLDCLLQQLVKGQAHHLFKLSEPHFNVNRYLYWLHKGYILALAADH